MTLTLRPRVLHVVPALFGASGIVGGAERYALELARHMADRVPTRLVSFGPSDASSREGNLDVRVPEQGNDELWKPAPLLEKLAAEGKSFTGA